MFNIILTSKFESSVLLVVMYTHVKLNVSAKSSASRCRVDIKKLKKLATYVIMYVHR